MVEKKKDQQYDVDNDEQYEIDIVAALSRSTINRLWIALILTIVLLFASNAWWVWRDSQFEDVVTTQTVEQDTDGGGDNSFVGGDYYGSAESDNDG